MFFINALVTVFWVTVGVILGHWIANKYWPIGCQCDCKCSQE